MSTRQAFFRYGNLDDRLVAVLRVIRRVRIVVVLIHERCLSRIHDNRAFRRIADHALEVFDDFVDVILLRHHRHGRCLRGIGGNRDLDTGQDLVHRIGHGRAIGIRQRDALDVF